MCKIEQQIIRSDSHDSYNKGERSEYLNHSGGNLENSKNRPSCSLSSKMRKHKAIEKRNGLSSPHQTSNIATKNQTSSLSNSSTPVNMKKNPSQYKNRMFIPNNSESRATTKYSRKNIPQPSVDNINPKSKFYFLINFRFFKPVSWSKK